MAKQKQEEKREISVDKFKVFSENLNKLIEDFSRVERGLSVSGDTRTKARMTAHKEILQLILGALP